MKTETQIAKDNIGNFLSTKKDNLVRTYCNEHKQTCQRDVIWLKDFMMGLEIANDQVPESNYKFWDYMKHLRIRHYNRDTDLRKAVKIYDEAGI